MTVFGWVASAFLGLLALTILGLIWFKIIKLNDLLNEANGQASMSRFQLLIFTFVIGLSLFSVTETNKAFPEIPTGILTLLGISASTYAVGKGISYSAPEVMMGVASGGGDDETDENDAAQAGADAAQNHAQDAKTQAVDAKSHAADAKQSAQDAKDVLNQVKQIADQVKGNTP